MFPLPAPLSHLLPLLLLLVLPSDVITGKPNLFLGFHTLDRGAGTRELLKLINYKGNVKGKLLTSALKYSIAVARGEYPAPRFGINVTALNIPQQFNISFIHRHSDIGDKIGTLKVLLDFLMRLNTSAVIGTQPSCDTEVKVASALNKPLFTIKCDKEIKERIEPRTFVRIQTPRWKIAKFIISILKHFNWHKYTLVVSKDTKWQLTARALTRYSKLHKKQILRVLEYGEPAKLDLHRIIKDSYKKTRIYVFLGNDLDISMFLGILYKEKLLQTGDYAVITQARHNFWKSKMNFFVGSLFGPSGRTQDMNLPLEAFRQTLILQPREAVQEADKAFVGNVLHFFKNPKKHLKEFNDRNPAALYDAVMVYLKAVAQVTRKENRKGRSVEEVLSNGTLVFEAIRGTTFETILGYDVAIDQYGEAEGNYSVYTLEKSPKNNLFRSVAWFSSAPKDSLPILHESKQHRIPWIKGKPPKAEPKCAFDGSKCGRLLDPIVPVPEVSTQRSRFWKELVKMRTKEHTAKMKLFRELKKKINEINGTGTPFSFTSLLKNCEETCNN